MGKSLTTNLKMLSRKDRLIIIYMVVLGLMALVGAYYFNALGEPPLVIMLLCISLICMIGLIVVPRESLQLAKFQEFKSARKDQFKKLIVGDKNVVLFNEQQYMVLECDTVNDKIEIQPLERPDAPLLHVGIFDNQLQFG